MENRNHMNGGQIVIPDVPQTPGVPPVWNEPVGRKETDKLAQSFPLLTKLAIIAAAIATLCLYDNHYGIFIPLCVVGLLGCYVLFCRKFEIKIKKMSYFYMVSSFLLGISTCLTMNPVILCWNAVARAALIILMLIHDSYNDREWSVYKGLRSIAELIVYGIRNLFQPFTHLAIFHKTERNSKHEQVAYILLGLSIAAPMTVVVMWLLSGADYIFRHMVESLFRSVILTGEPIWILLFFLLSFFVTYAIMCTVVKKDIKETEKEGRNKEALVGITFTIPLTVIYLFFCGIQLTNILTAGALLPKEYTYAQYAREGFFQLLFVTVLNCILVMVCVRLFRENRVLKILLTIISGCTYIMVASSAYRMILYIQAYCLTRMRVMVLAALVVIVFLVTGILVHIFRKHFPLFLYSVVVVTSVYLLLSFSGMDWQIARYNLAHESMADSLKYAYMSASMDAVPVYEKAYHQENVKLVENEEADFGKLYLEMCRTKYEMIYGTDGAFSIRKFNFAANRAHSML